MLDGAAGAPAPDRLTARAAPRSLAILVGLLLIAFLAALAFQAETRRRDLIDAAIARQMAHAEFAAARLDERLARLSGAAALAASVGAGADPALVAETIGAMPGVASAAVFDAGLSVRAAYRASPAHLRALRAAARAAATQASWIGAPQIEGEAARPVLVRRRGGVVIAALLDPAALAPSAYDGAQILVSTADGRIVFATREAAARSAEDKAALVGATAGAAVTTADGRAWAVGAAAAGGGAFQVTLAAQGPSLTNALLGALLHIALLAGAPMAAVTVLLLLLRQNAQRAARAEAEAERAESQFRLAADGARAGIFEWNAGANLVTLSEQASLLIHRLPGALNLEDFIALAVPEDQKALQQEFTAATRSGAFDARFRVAHGAGLIWLEARGVVLEDGAENAPLRLIGTLVDVTHRQEAQARVARLERQLRAAIDSFTGPFALWDARKRLMVWNGAFAQAFQIGPELLRPRASYEAVAMASAACIKRERVDPNDSQIREIELASGQWVQIVERRTTDGGLVTVGVDITALKRQEEALTRNDKRLRDLVSRLEKSETENKVLARQADEERRKAEDASRAKSAFLANMSHELRTPLNAIIGFSEIMAKELFGPIGNPQYHQYANDIFSSGGHLLDMINDILDMAKIEAGKMTLAPRPLDPSVAIEQAVRLTRRRAEEKGLQILTDMEDVPEIEADHRAVKQMLINLLSNAIKFTDEGAIMVRARPTPEGLVLRVVDTGCGIPADQLPRLARPFEQVESTLARNHSGTGLGLALTKTLAEMHGGRMEIQSTVGQGTIVSIYLPARFAGAASVLEDGAAGDGVSSAAPAPAAREAHPA